VEILWITAGREKKPRVGNVLAPEAASFIEK